MDGTTNFKDDTQAHPWTNVAFLSEWVPDDLPPGAERYVRGVGSDDAESVESLAGVRNLFGRILGYGLTGKVRAVYESLCRYHADQKDIYLFGFSRGACAARVVAGFVDEVGILLADKLDRVDDAWEIYIKSGDPDVSDLRDYLKQLGDARRPSADTATQLRIFFLGVWDTVAMWFTVNGAPFDPTSRLSRIPSNVTHARQALAIHEVRRYFPELPWMGLRREGRPTTVKQIWFPGDHADVGGGNAVEEQGLSRDAFDWMMTEAEAVGLPLKKRDVSVPPSPAGRRVVHDESHRNLRFLRGFRSPFVGVRQGLTDWALLQPDMLKDLYVSAAYIKWLAEGRSLDREPDIPVAISDVMAQAEEAAVRFQMQRRYVVDGIDPPDWLSAVTVSDVVGCSTRAGGYVSTLGQPAPATLDRDLSIWVLLAGPEAWKDIDNAVRKAVGDPRTPPTDKPSFDRLSDWWNRLLHFTATVERLRKTLPQSLFHDEVLRALHVDVVKPLDELCVKNFVYSWDIVTVKPPIKFPHKPSS
jgi:uncharacterized protein (DUF2235 family)